MSARYDREIGHRRSEFLVHAENTRGMYDLMRGLRKSPSIRAEVESPPLFRIASARVNTPNTFEEIAASFYYVEEESPDYFLSGYFRLRDKTPPEILEKLKESGLNIDGEGYHAQLVDIAGKEQFSYQFDGRITRIYERIKTTLDLRAKGKRKEDYAYFTQRISSFARVMTNIEEAVSKLCSGAKPREPLIIQPPKLPRF